MAVFEVEDQLTLIPWKDFGRAGESTYGVRLQQSLGPNTESVLGELVRRKR